MSKAKFVIIASLIVIAVMLFLNFRQGRRVPEFETAVVERGNITISIFASGEIKSAAQTDVFAQTSGAVSNLPVKDGQRAYQGQILLQLDTTWAKALVAQKELALGTARQKKRNLEDGVYSEIDLKAAEALANERRRAWVRAEEDYNEDKSNEDRRAARDTAYTVYLQTEENLENLKNSNPTGEDWVAIEAEIESAKKALVDAELELSRTTVTAPQNGTLIFADSGTGKVSSTSVVSKGQKLFTVADFSSFIFEVEVDETDIHQIEVGQKAIVSLDAYSDARLEGEVSELEKTIVRDLTGNKVVRAEIDLNLKGLERFYLGLSGDAEIIQEEKKNVLLIPVEAVSAEAGKNFVYAVKDDKLIKREVRLGLENDDTVEVVSGVREGEKAVITKF